VSIERNLEKDSDRDKWRRWTELAIGEPECPSFNAHNASHIHRNIGSGSGSEVAEYDRKRVTDDA